MKKVLLIDDEEPIRRLLATVLEMGDFQVTSAVSAADGIRILRDQPFEVVVTDLRMESPLAGYEVVKEACKMRPQPLTVILTAFPIPASEWKNAGADALLTKGGETLNLSDRIERLLRTKASYRIPSPPGHPVHRQ